MFFRWARDYWDRYGWTVIFWASLFVLFLLWFFFSRFNRNGSYSTDYVYIPPLTSSMPTSYAPPKTDDTFGYDPNYNNTSKGEFICRQFMESTFRRPFRRTRPAFMRNPITGENLELDLYNEELRLAVEYNGRQHYKYSTYMHQNSKDKFMNQQYRDYIKKDLCDKHGVRLIIVPYTIAHKDIPAFLSRELEKISK
jgi:hypothetical protein